MEFNLELIEVYRSIIINIVIARALTFDKNIEFCLKKNNRNNLLIYLFN